MLRGTITLCVLNIRPPAQAHGDPQESFVSMSRENMISYCAKTPPTENHSKIERLIVL
jgi:hypothetical protein